MKLISIGLWAIPIFSLGVYSLHYVSNPDNLFNYYGPLATSNSDLILDLKKSREKDYKTELKGYETSIRKTSYPYIPRNTIRYTGRNPTDEATGKSIINVIQDYSVKLQTPCGSGTGWFLDYVLPENSGYPVKWFIATNAHVVDNMSFGSNPYKQELPVRWWAGCSPSYSSGYTPLALFKEKTDSGTSNGIVKHDNFPDLFSKGFHIGNKEREAVHNAEHYDEEGDPEFVYFLERTPKLFYASINYLGANPRALGYKWTINNYYKDFAVLEVDFKNEKTAKLLTRDFYTKYDLNTGTNKSKALDLFAHELLEDKSSDQLFDEEKDYFISGYASNGEHPYRSSGNYSRIYKRASRLTYPNLSRDKELISLKNRYGSNIIGHTDTGQIDESFGNRNTVTFWNGKYHNNWGYNYLLDNAWLGAGASGSLTADSDGKVIGLYRMHDSVGKQGYVEPLRSKGIYENGKIIYPKYDLIEGTTGQISSFKDQIVKYYLSKNKTTGLSKYRNWSASSLV